MRLLAVMPVALMLAACGEKEVNLMQLCDQHPNFCAELWDPQNPKTPRI